jgi:outer membrane lipoprotein SlyB
MKKLLIASLAVVAMVSPAFAQDADADADGGAAVGGVAGGAAGAVAGGLIFGPIGAVIGGFTGAVIGAEAGVEASTVEYARLNPTEPVIVEGDIDVGFVVPETVTIAEVEGDAEFGYFYTEDRLWIVNLADRTVVYSPGTVVAAEGEADADAEVTVEVESN